MEKNLELGFSLLQQAANKPLKNKFTGQNDIGMLNKNSRCKLLITLLSHFRCTCRTECTRECLFRRRWSAAKYSAGYSMVDQSKR